MEAQFARMRLRLNFISDDICSRTVVWTKAKKRALVYDLKKFYFLLEQSCLHESRLNLL